MRIIFRADGYKDLGLGHIYNCITLAHAMSDRHDVLIITRSDAQSGLLKLREEGLPLQTITTDTEIDAIVEKFKPDVWVNDCLNTSIDYVRHLKEMIPRVVTIEDLGDGAKEADAVINALYPSTEKSGHIYSGHQYACLRDEFQHEHPNAFSKQVKNVVIMFGGTDPSNLNAFAYNCIERIQPRYPNIIFNFIVGVGYDCVGNNILTNERQNIFVHPNVRRVTDYMKLADLAVTGQGRTIFEVAAMGVPTIVLSQNIRETTHGFARLEHGFVNLGLGTKVDETLFCNTLDWLINAVNVRQNMYELMLQCSLRAGLVRVVNIITGEIND